MTFTLGFALGLLCLLWLYTVPRLLARLSELDRESALRTAAYLRGKQEATRRITEVRFRKALTDARWRIHSQRHVAVDEYGADRP